MSEQKIREGVDVELRPVVLLFHHRYRIFSRCFLFVQFNDLTITFMQNFLDIFIAHINDMTDGVKYLGGKGEKLEKDVVHYEYNLFLS